MTINEFSFDGDLEDASEGDLRETLNEFMEKHEENVEQFNELQEDASEFEDRAESAEDKVSTLKTYFAEEVAEASALFSAEEIAEKYDAETLMEKAGEAAEFSEEPEGGQEGDGGGQFSDKEQKSRTGGGTSGPEKSDFAKKAKDDLEALGFDAE